MSLDPVLRYERDKVLSTEPTRIAPPADDEPAPVLLAKIERIDPARLTDATIVSDDPRWDGAVRCAQLMRLWRARLLDGVAWENHPDAAVLEMQALVLPLAALPASLPTRTPQNVKDALAERHAGVHDTLARRL